jgi:hypothetical protein
MERQTAFYINFPVYETIEIKDTSDICIAVTRMVDAYAYLCLQENFSFRLLLPRGERLNAKARRIGIVVETEFLLALKRRKLKPNIKEIRYVHDEKHFGWLLVSPKKLNISKI